MKHSIENDNHNPHGSFDALSSAINDANVSMCREQARELIDDLAHENLLIEAKCHTDNQISMLRNVVNSDFELIKQRIDNTIKEHTLLFRRDLKDYYCLFCNELSLMLVKLNERIDAMDKKMHKITKSMKTAEKDVKKGKPKAAVKVLKKAEKKNEKLVKIDRTKRDPVIEKAKRVMKKFPKDWKKA